MTVDAPYKLGEDFFQNPYPTYAELNRRGPVQHVEFPSGMRVWLITDYDLAKQVLLDPTMSKDLYGPAGETAQRNGNVVLRLDPRVNDHMLYADPPRHTRLRNIVMKALSGNAVRDLAPRVAEIADALLADMAGRPEVDLIEAYALPLAISVISQLLGVPVADRTIFQTWLTVQLSTAGVDEKYAAAAEFQRYVADLVENRRSGAQATDLLAELIAATDDGGHLSESELVAMVNALLLGSQETTAGMIGNAVRILLGDRGLFEDLRRDDYLIRPFIDEVLRFEGSVHMATYRFTTAQVILGSQRIDSGQIVLVSLAAADRDAEQFDRPHRFDVSRMDNRHIAFGYGVHRCVGAALARTEVSIAVARLLAVFPELDLAVPAGDLCWQSSVITRALVELPVRPGRYIDGR
ncbi:cytochrome P450 family protein [Nocardia nova]|uniref:cytochrome P450 family protein n=1 Tax=Nocardia nova TaxID=37330 RepID=UPI0007A4169A|nr:cytochrome P450 [Nocardia nova]